MSGAGGHDSPVSDDDEEVRLRNQEIEAQFAIRREERSMTGEQRRLTRELADLREDEEQTKHAIEAELRREHWGKDPERLLAWEDHARDDVRRAHGCT